MLLPEQTYSLIGLLPVYNCKYMYLSNQTMLRKTYDLLSNIFESTVPKFKKEIMLETDRRTQVSGCICAETRPRESRLCMFLREATLGFFPEIIFKFY